MEESQLRNLLINSCHSCTEAEDEIEKLVHSGSIIKDLVHIAADHNGGDAPMQASYYLSKASGPQIHQYEEQLLVVHQM